MENKELGLILWKKKSTSIWRLFIYFVFYSIFGLILETIYVALVDGVVESRTSFLYGPFCAIYGLGAVIMTILLQRLENSKKVFFMAMVIGSVTEFLISYVGEMIYHVKWWDYSYMPLNIAGRTSLIYSVIWGCLGFMVVKVINPNIDRVLDKIEGRVQEKILYIIVAIMIAFLAVDYIVSSVVLDLFTARVVVEYDLDVYYKEQYKKKYDRIYGNETIAKIIDELWGYEKMIITFPENKIELTSGESIFIKDLRPDIKSYWFKLYER